MSTLAAAAAGRAQPGRYLVFVLGEEEYGVEVLKVREIIGPLPITRVPRMPHTVLGVINLRGAVIPVVDLRVRFGLAAVDHGARTCMIVMLHRCRRSRGTGRSRVRGEHDRGRGHRADAVLRPDGRHDMPAGRRACGPAGTDAARHRAHPCRARAASRRARQHGAVGAMNFSVAEFRPDQFRQVSELMHRISGIHLHSGKRELVRARLTTRMRELRLHGPLRPAQPDGPLADAARST
jgi:hypothetical protein